MARVPVFLRVVVLLGVGSFSLPLLAQTDDASQFFREGVAAFQQGDLQQSRALLEQAATMGHASSALRYNLGVVYFKLGEYDQAKRSFELLLETPHRDLARYNLGLIAQATGQVEQANALFASVYDTATEPKLRELALRQLENDSVPIQTSPSWYLFASAGLGYEENLSLLPDTAPSEANDSYHEAVLYTRGPLFQLDTLSSEASRIEGHASYYQRRYHHDQSYNTDALEGGLSWYVDKGGASRRLGVEQVYFWANRSSRETHSGLYGDWRWQTCMPSTSGVCQVRADVTRVHPFDGYEAYRGMRYNALGRYRLAWGDWRGSVSYELELNDRDNYRSDNQSVDVSPSRHLVELGVDYFLTQAFSLGGAVEYRRSSYGDDYRFPGTAADYESGHRSDDRYTALMQVEYAFKRAWSLIFEATYERNESSLAQYAYDNQSYQLTLNYFVP